MPGQVPRGEPAGANTATQASSLTQSDLPGSDSAPGEPILLGLTVVVDHQPGEPPLPAEHGFSAWLSMGGRRVLFG